MKELEFTIFTPNRDTVRLPKVLAEKLSDVDRREIVGVTGLSPETSIWLCFRDSIKGLTALVYGGPTWEDIVGAFGITRSPTGEVYRPWFICTDELRKHRVLITTLAHGIIKDFRKLGNLENYVSTENTRAIKWLKFLGFTIHKEKHTFHGDVTYHRFTMSKIES